MNRALKLNSLRVAYLRIRQYVRIAGRALSAGLLRLGNYGDWTSKRQLTEFPVTLVNCRLLYHLTAYRAPSLLSVSSPVA